MTAHGGMKYTMEKRRKNPHAVALGRLGGLKGGLARARKLSKEELSAQGRRAVLVRWAKGKVRRVTVG